MHESTTECKEEKTQHIRPLSDSEDLQIYFLKKQRKRTLKKRLLFFMLTWLCLLGSFLTPITDFTLLVRNLSITGCLCFSIVSVRSTDLFSRVNGWLVFLFCIGRLVYIYWPY